MAQATDDTGYDVAQYVNADRSASGEFVMDAPFGFWAYSQPQLGLAGSTPVKVTVNNLITAPFDGKVALALTAWNVLDLAGVFVRTGSFPPNYVQNGAYSYKLLLLASADMLMMPIQAYGTGWASYDLGTSWFTVTGWGPRGSTKPTVPGLADNTDLLMNGTPCSTPSRRTAPSRRAPGRRRPGTPGRPHSPRDRRTASGASRAGSARSRLGSPGGRRSPARARAARRA